MVMVWGLAARGFRKNQKQLCFLRNKCKKVSKNEMGTEGQRMENSLMQRTFGGNFFLRVGILLTLWALFGRVAMFVGVFGRFSFWGALELFWECCCCFSVMRCFLDDFVVGVLGD